MSREARRGRREKGRETEERNHKGMGKRRKIEVI